MNKDTRKDRVDTYRFTGTRGSGDHEMRHLSKIAVDRSARNIPSKRNRQRCSCPEILGLDKSS